ncbi:hypothetical protein GOP47_0013315 [Adiantum capillus-veneris]|uniref:Uncharacterized protein n=1 Tax=Adiantum capillus-veneris TaxID=13818 RepID=A0A9D4ZDB0_ADICA|nr:hypothetical protein GOP47_0013315 [Adiantum capillus-veneris]
MAAIVDSMKGRAWKTAVQTIIPPGMRLLEEECMDYSIAEIYTGPRPAYVPKAEPIRTVTQTVVCSRQSCSPPSSSYVVVDARADPLCMSQEGCFSETLEGFPSSVCHISLKEAFSETEDAAVISQNILYEDAEGISDLEYKKKDSLEAGAAIDVGLHSSGMMNHRASLSRDDTVYGNSHDSNARDVSMEDVFASLQLEPGEAPYSEQEDHNSSPQSELFGQRSSASHSSTNSFSHELGDQLTPEPSPSNNQPRKKGECFLCGKVSRVQGKETCLVCPAKYCSGCVTKAMGSMPEGRKCSGCIGKPICESRRQELGKPSKLLSRLLSNLEVQQIMKAERNCPANQLRPEQVYVNGRPLTGKEFGELLGCKYPPSKLKPGRYWYDGGCGYWGKEGDKPEKIISHSLNIGSELSENASAGSTDVYINNREITKVELKMLKFAGFPVSPRTRFWVDAEGSCTEEGHNHCRGNIWAKASARYLCYIFSLPMPPNTCVAAPEPSISVPAYYEPKTIYKILLLGHAGSGTSTIIKQAKFLYEDKFTPKELQDIKALIQRNIYRYLIVLLEARERFEDEENAIRKKVQENTPSTSSGDAGPELQSVKANIFSLTARLKDQADWFLRTDANGELEKYCPAVTREHASVIEELWRDPAIQATHKRKAELHLLPDVAEHFLSKVVSISSNDYSPLDRDILFAEGVTNDFGLAEVQFCIEEESQGSGPYAQSLEQSLAEPRYHLIRISSSGSTDGCKLFKMFDDVRAVLFCVALDSYDQMWPNGNEPLQNKMLLSRDLFGSIVKYPSFRDKPVVLFLNKYDSFEEKISIVPLTTCEWFSDFHPVKSSTQTSSALAQQAYTYVAHMFKKHFEIVNPGGGKLYTFQLKALDRSSVGAALQYVKEILVWEDVKNQGVPLTSCYTTETSSLVIQAQRSDILGASQ